MIRNRFIFSIITATGLSASAASLQFTNVTSAVFPGGFTGNLLGVAYGNGTSFVAVGSNGVFATSSFTTNAPLIVAANWAKGTVPQAGNSALRAAAFGVNTFVAIGDSNSIYSSLDGLSWSTTHKAFGNNAIGSGVAFNNSVFVAVAQAPEIAWTGLPLPTSSIWNNATLNNVSFLESFRAVAPFGSGSFVACGLFGGIRTSTDSGQNWSLANGGVGQPDLFGVAGNAGQTLVAVGAGNPPADTSGIVLISTDGGMNWNLAANGVSALNSVAALGGSSFLTVGNNGEIFYTTDGVGWNPQNATVSANLYGVAFATNGFLAGIGEVVGAGGTILLCGTPPQDPVSNGNLSRCQGSPLTNSPLSVTTVFDSSHPAGTLTIDWYTTNSSGLVPYASGTNIIIPQNDAPFDANTASNYYYFAVSRDLRTSFTNGNPILVSLTISPRPTATLGAYSATNCDVGASYTLTNILTGIGPWTVTWNDTTIQTVPIAGSGPATLTRTVTPGPFDSNHASNHVYFVTGVSNADTCIANQPGDIQGNVSILINPRPTATLGSYSATNCDIGASYALTNTLTGIGPWTVTWSDGTVQTVATIGSGPVTLTRNVTPIPFDLNHASNNVYYVTTVSNADTCLGNHSNDITGSVSVLINPRPTATLASYATTNCDLGATYTLTNILTGLGPWTVTWNDGTVQAVGTVGSGPVTLTRNVTPHPLDLNHASNNVYSVTSVSNADTCVSQGGDISGNVAIWINPRPRATLAPLTTAGCNAGTVYTLTNILSGVGPWTVWWNDGTKQTDNATGPGPVTLTRNVTPIPLDPNTASNNIYYVTIVSNLDTCLGNQAGDITGTNQITINPRPTSVVSGTATICNGSSTSVQAALTGIGPWSVTWSSNGVPVVTNTGVASSPNVLLVAPNNTNSSSALVATYTVSALSDANCTANPGDRTGSAVVTVNPRPTATVTGTTPICNGSSTIVHAALTGIGPWTVTWTSNGVVVATHSGVSSSPDNLSVSPTNTDLNNPFTPTYTVSALSDLHCTANAGDLTGSAVITVYPRPTSALMSFSTTNCDLGTTYTLTNALTGIAPWTVVWSSNGIPVATNASVASSPDTLSVTLTNATATNVLTAAYTISTLTDSHCTASAGDRAGSVSITVMPVLSATDISNPSFTMTTNSSITITNILTGAAPWTLMWSDGTNQSASSSTSTRIVHGTEVAAHGTNFTYYLTNLTDASAAAGCTYTSITGSNTINIVSSTNWAARVSASFSNATNAIAETASVQVCSGNSNVIYAAMNTNFYSGSGGWWVVWSDGVKSPATAPSHPATSNVVARVITTNGTYTVKEFWFKQPGPDGEITDTSLLQGSVTLTVNSLPAAPTNPQNGSNCACLTPVLSVTVPQAYTVNWYYTNGALLSSGPSFFTPTNKNPGQFAYFASAVNTNGCESASTTPVLLTLTACTNQLTIAVAGTNGLLIWSGTQILQSTTNLIMPSATNSTWLNVMTGAAGCNTSIWHKTDAPNKFFRLYGP